MRSIFRSQYEACAQNCRLENLEHSTVRSDEFIARPTHGVSLLVCELTIIDGEALCIAI